METEWKDNALGVAPRTPGDPAIAILTLANCDDGGDYAWVSLDGIGSPGCGIKFLGPPRKDKCPVVLHPCEDLVTLAMLHGMMWHMVKEDMATMEQMAELMVIDPVELFGHEVVTHPGGVIPGWKWDKELWRISWLPESFDLCVHISVKPVHTRIIHAESFRRWRMMELL